MRSDLHEANRLSWNAATRAHNSHKADQAAFFRNGGSTLYPEELQLLGHLDGLRLLHLQCNAGQDSLSLARLGARVTGVDIADSAIDFARQLSRDSGIAADFQRDDILRWLPSPPPAANASNGSSPPTARWSGSPTSSAGPTASPRCWFPAGASSWWSSILSPCTSTHTGNRPTTTSAASRSPRAASATMSPSPAPAWRPPATTPASRTSATLIPATSSSGAWPM
ncbi:TPA: methyltransferase domain-containing protein [Pseudomonas aeruginosa]|nr:methyltransferase domain-containing protein [Pseudomonas aeruginosa]